MHSTYVQPSLDGTTARHGCSCGWEGSTTTTADADRAAADHKKEHHHD